MNLGLKQFHAGHEIYFLPYLQLKIWTFSVGKFIKWRSDCVMQSSWIRFSVTGDLIAIL